MSNRIAALLLALGSAAVGFAQEPPKTPTEVKGRVVLDVNGDGKIDDGDKGMAKVLVTDGIHFVETAADGTYAIKIGDDPVIPYRPARVVSVSWPSGYWPVRQQFYARLSDVGAGENVDFLLREDKQRLPFTVVHGTDPHNDLTDIERFRDDIDRMDKSVQFCILTGDLGYMGRETAEKSFANIARATRTFPIPMFHAPGNHDICDIHTDKWSEQHPLAAYGPYTKYLGPIRWSFNYAGTHFVGLDWARIAPDGKLQTGTPDVVIDWLKRDLAHVSDGTRIFVFMHHHFRHEDDRFWDLLVERKVELVLAGHSHRNLNQTRRGVKALTTMNLCGPYRLLTVREKDHVIVERCFAGTAAGHMHSYAGSCKMGEWRKAPLVRGPVREFEEREVKDGSSPLEGIQFKNFELTAEIDEHAAAKFGVRVVPAEGSAPRLEIACVDDELRCGDIATKAVASRGEKAAHLRVIVKDNVVSAAVNNRARIDVPLECPEGFLIHLFAEGGRVHFTKATVAELK